MTQPRGRDPNVSRLQQLVELESPGQPRIAPARQRDLAPVPRTVAAIAGRITGTGPPNVFTTLGRHPRLFRAWLWYSAHLMPFGTLPRRDAELVILRVAWRRRSAYEWHQHVPLALRVGLTPEEVAAAADAAPQSQLTGRQRVLLAITDEQLAGRRLSDQTWGVARTILTTRELIELCLLIGHYQGLASAIGALGIPVEDGVAPAVHGNK